MTAIRQYSDESVDETMTKAEDVLSEASALIEEARSDGLDVSAAQALLSEAQNSFNAGDIDNALRKGLEARDSVMSLRGSSSMTSEALRNHYVRVIGEKIGRMEANIDKLEARIGLFAENLADDLEQRLTSRLTALRGLLADLRASLSSSFQ